VLISGNIPFKTEVASVHIFSLVESDAPSAGAAVSVLLLLVSLVTLIGFDILRRWRFSGGG
jgi:sulfate/thiosulfate transport system permease protein